MHGIITITFNSDFAIWQAASPDKHETRQLLKYVQVHPSGLMLATDGHIAAVVPCTIEGAPEDWGGVLVPADFLKELLKQTRTAEAVFTLVDEEVIGLGKTGKFTAHTGQGTFPRIDMILKSAVDRAADSKGMTVCYFKSALLDRLGQALGYEKGGFVPHQWIKPESAILCYGERNSGAVGLMMPGAQEVAEDAAAYGRDAVRSTIAKLTGQACPVKQAA